MRSRLVRPSAALLVAALVAAAPGVAHAGELEDFQAARAAYEAHDFALAVTLFEALVGGPAPAIDSPDLVLESRKYLGAAYLLVGRRDAAGEQFDLLLAASPSYELDPAAFPIEVLELFAAVREQIAERERIATERAGFEARHERDVERLRAVVEFAEEEIEVEVERSRWIAAIPFGVGQFENGDEVLGSVLLVSELLVAGTVFGTLAGREYVLAVANAEPAGSFVMTGEASRLANALQIANWTSASLLGALFAVGLVEAEISFRPTRTVRHRRRVPPALLDGIELSIGPGSLGMAFSF